MTLKSLRASLMERLDNNTRKDYTRENLFTYNATADRPLQRDELETLAEAVGITGPQKYANKGVLREEIRSACNIDSDSRETFSEGELRDIGSYAIGDKNENK